MTASDFWSARPCLEHVQTFARSRRVAPLSMLGSLVARGICSLDPNVVLPPTIGGYASLNLAVAFVGPSGFGKGATEAAARDATDLPAVPELPAGTGEGTARTFAANDDGEQPVRAAMLTASEVDGLAALGARSGSTVMAVFRQAISGESIGGANAQKHTRVIVPAHSYRCVFTIGVQPERAGALLSDTAGTAQRLWWVPTADPDVPDRRPSEPDRWHIPRTVVPADRRTVLSLPPEAVAEMDGHQLRKLRGDDGIDPLDGHKLLTQAKIAAGLMVLDGRMHTVTLEDWQLARVLIAESDRTRSRVQQVIDDSARRSNRAKAHAVAERDEVVADRKLERAKSGVLRWLERDGELPRNELRTRARSDWRDQVSAALADLVANGVVTEIRVDRGTRYRLSDRSTLDRGSTPETRRSATVDPPSTLDPSREESPGNTPPGGVTSDTPGLSPRVLKILNGGAR